MQSIVKVTAQASKGQLAKATAQAIPNLGPESAGLKIKKMNKLSSLPKGFSLLKLSIHWRTATFGFSFSHPMHSHRTGSKAASKQPDGGARSWRHLSSQDDPRWWHAGSGLHILQAIGYQGQCCLQHRDHGEQGSLHLLGVGCLWCNRSLRRFSHRQHSD